MKYHVDEITYTLQGEGLRAGSPSIFIRLAGCNLRCAWCDQPDSLTRRGSDKMTVQEILDAAAEYPTRWLVLTGGEPLTRYLGPLLDVAHGLAYLVACETNGTLFRDWVMSFDHICVSPKSVLGGTIDSAFYSCATEFKFIFDSQDAVRFIESHLRAIPSDVPVFIQPEYSRMQEILPSCLSFILDHGDRLRLSLQTHKLVGLP